MNAETQLCWHVDSQNDWASMGPRSHERGNGSHDSPREGNNKLQWGRVLMNAETGGQNPVFQSARRLQWGRVLMNAETSSDDLLEFEGELLQWGRVLMNAETWSIVYSAWHAGHASMGPRSHERGNGAAPSRTSMSANWLQWGRVLMNAETILSVNYVNGRAVLQWGRVLMNAETTERPRLGI